MRYPHGVEAEIRANRQLAEHILKYEEPIKSLLRACIDLSSVHILKHHDCNCEICNILKANPELKLLIDTV